MAGAEAFHLKDAAAVTVSEVEATPKNVAASLARQRCPWHEFSSSSTGSMDCRAISVPDGRRGSYGAGALEFSGWLTECPASSAVTLSAHAARIDGTRQRPAAPLASRNRILAEPGDFHGAALASAPTRARGGLLCEEVQHGQAHLSAALQDWRRRWRHLPSP